MTAKADIDFDQLTPNTVIAQTFRQIWDNLPQILIVGVFFNLLCWPAFILALLGLWVPAVILGLVLVGPAWLALLAQLAALLAYKVVPLKHLGLAFIQHWLNGVKLSTMALVPIFALWLTLPAFARPEVSLIIWVGLGADLLGLILVAVLFLYAFPLLVLYDITVREAIQNSFVLASRHWINTFGVLSLGVCLGFGAYYLSSAILFILPVFLGIFIINTCRLVVRLEETNEDSPTTAHL